MATKIDNLQLQAINEYWRKEMGRNNISCDVKFSDLIAYNLVDPSIGDYVEAGGSTVMFVDAVNGSDSNDGSIYSPFKTLSRACDEIPLKAQKNITVKVRAGNYDEHITVVTTIYPEYDVIIEGIDFVPATIASGVLSGVINSVNTKFLTRNLAGWTSGDLSEKYIKITSGQHSGRVFCIVNNTSDTIELQNSISGLVGATFELVNTTVFVQDTMCCGRTFDIAILGGSGRFIARNIKTFSNVPIEFTMDMSIDLDVDGQNLGNGVGVFAQATSGPNVLQFKSLVGSGNVGISSNSSQITINGIGSPVTNLGTGEGIGASVGGDVQLKSLKASGAASISSDSNSITITGTGEANTASNLGSGLGVFKEKIGSDLKFKSLVAGTNISLSLNDNEITIGTIGTGEANTASNLTPVVGGYEGLFSTKTGVDLKFKSLVAGSNITLSSDTNTVTIDASAAGEANTASNLTPAEGSYEGLFAQKSGVDLKFKSLVAGTGVSLTANSNTVTISASGSSTYVPWSLDNATHWTYVFNDEFEEGIGSWSQNPLVTFANPIATRLDPYDNLASYGSSAFVYSLSNRTSSLSCQLQFSLGVSDPRQTLPLFRDISLSTNNTIWSKINYPRFNSTTSDSIGFSLAKTVSLRADSDNQIRFFVKTENTDLVVKVEKVVSGVVSSTLSYTVPSTGFLPQYLLIHKQDDWYYCWISDSNANWNYLGAVDWVPGTLGDLDKLSLFAKGGTDNPRKISGWDFIRVSEEIYLP